MQGEREWVERRRKERGKRKGEKRGKKEGREKMRLSEGMRREEEEK